MKNVLASILLLITGLATASEVNFLAKDGWIRSAPPGALALAGYVQLGNESTADLTIVGASSAAFESVVFHESYEDDGIARMRAMSELVVPRGGSLSLQPGGIHLMLLRPTRDIRDGATIIVDLLTEEGDPLPVVLKVRPNGGGDHAEHADHSQH